jgi:hypothetical protein
MKIGALTAAVVGLLTILSSAEASDGKADSPDVVARSKVWLPTDTASKDLRVGPTGPGSFPPDAIVTCDYFDRDSGGASPKFWCRLPDGDELRVKYGGSNGEVYGEVAATRLLWALGFGADRVYSVRVICRGCPEKVGTLSENGDRIVDPAAVERRVAGSELEDEWSWRELNAVDELAGGATRAERDAFKLLAVLLQHTDNKSKQQRIVCVEPVDAGRRDCQTPLIVIDDLGLTFGKANWRNSQSGASVNLEKWSRTPIWKDRQECIGQLSGSATGTLDHPAIGEEGRGFLAGLLMQLSDRQLSDMFEAARVNLRPRNPSRGASGYPDIEEWVRVFKDKRDQIVNHRCPA